MNATTILHAVNVLTVLNNVRAAANDFRPLNSLEYQETLEATAAIKELIEREKALREFVESLVLPADREINASVSVGVTSRQARAVLASVGGAA